jgi:glycosyltransferase involved in cell wall biosynthesis
VTLVDPKVTVLMPVFNRKDLVNDAIRSVLEQDFVDLELLVVDDGSTDGTAGVLETWRKRDARVVVVQSPQNVGIPRALNLGLAHSRGEYVARLDSDDLLMPHRLAQQVAVLDHRPEVALVSSAYDIVDLSGVHLGRWKGDEPSEVISFLLHFFNAVGGGGQVMFRLADVLEEGGYAPGYPSSEDYDLWVRLLRRGRIVTLPLVGMIKRTHSQQSHALYSGVKRANWSGIMRFSLEPYLNRALSDEEIAGLITLWRGDRRLCAAAIADRVMREAFDRFRNDHPSERLRSCARRRIARQWYLTARILMSAGHPLETLTYLAYGVRWLVTR